MRVYLIEGVALYWLVLNVVRDLPTFRRAMWTLLIAGALLGALGTWQAATDTYGRSFGGLAHRQVEVVSADQGLDAETVHLRVSNRAEGPVDEPNRFAQILIVLLPLALLAFRTETSRGARALAALGGVLVLAGVLLTYSRGAFLVLVALVAALVWVKWLRSRHALALTLGVMLVLPLIAPSYQQRIASIGNVTALLERQTQARADGAIRGRTTAMLAALNVFADHPVLGVGPGQYSPVYSLEYQNLPGVSFRDLTTSRRAHSLYLEMAAELGIVGLTVFLAMVGLLLRDLLRSRRTAGSREMSDLSTALALGLAAYLGTALFLHLSFERYFWLLLALCSAGLHVVRGSVAVAESPGGGPAPGGRPPQRAASAGPRRPWPTGGLVTPRAGWAKGAAGPSQRASAPRPRLGLLRLAHHVATVAARATARFTVAALRHGVAGSRVLAATSKALFRSLTTIPARTRAARRAAKSFCEEVRSRFFYRALDAFLTAPVAVEAARLRRRVNPAGRSHYARVQAFASALDARFPNFVFRLRKRLIRADRLPLVGYRGPETLGYGAGCTVFRLPARTASGDGRRDVVLKVLRKTLGRGPDNALAACRESRERYQRLSRLYSGGELILTTSFMVVHSPLLGQPATVTIQPRIDRSARDFFLDVSDRELLAAIRAHPRFADQLRIFVSRAVESVRTTGRCLDLVGRGNVVVVTTSDGPRMKIIDFGEINLSEWARSKPRAEREVRRRIARLERLSVPKGVNPQVEKVLWRR
jgi:O-antigen ligase